MELKLFYDILDCERKKILSFLGPLKKDFYLAGGTALALQIGHRDSIDFDFFSQKSFSTIKLFKQIQTILKGHRQEYRIKKIQEARDTLTVFINNKIKISFFAYEYRLIRRLLNAEYIHLASLADIGCMKLSAIVSRATVKDYIDLYFILHKIDLTRLLNYAEKKFPTIDTNLILKSLVYFDDVEKEPIMFKHGKKISFLKVQTFLRQEIKKYSLKMI